MKNLTHNNFAPKERGKQKGGNFLIKTLCFLCVLLGPITSLNAASVLPAISDAQAQEIGKRIWQNECGGTISGLTS